MADDKWVYLENVQPGVGANNSTKWVQKELNRQVGARLAVDGIFGPITKAAYAKWQTLAGFDPDGTPGTGSLGKLGALACEPWTVRRKSEDEPSTPSQPTTPPPSTGTPSVGDYLTQPEPAHNYSRVTYGGKTVNVRTREMLKVAAVWANVTIRLTQGSYNTGVAASAGTHDGGGCVDIDVSSWSAATRSKVQLVLRKAGFAAWLRTPAEGFAYHIHACAIGDKEMASVARNQVQSYFNRRNGLANNASDNTEHRWPNWADKYNK